MPEPIVDSHQHFWQVGLFDYPWMSEDSGVLYRDYLPTELESKLKANGVDQTVLVQASNTIAESRWLLSLADEYSFIAGVVGWVDLASPHVEEQLIELSAHAKFKGVRHLVENEPADDWILQSEVINGLHTLAAFGLTYDLLVKARHLKHVGKLAEACPQNRFVIDHLAKPPIESGDVKEWASELKPLADYPNIFCKLSGLVTEANHKTWCDENLRPYVEAALELFTPSRLMFGSDHPVCLLAASYEQVLNSFQTLLGGLTEEELEKIFRTNAIEFYKLQ